MSIELILVLVGVGAIIIYMFIIDPKLNKQRIKNNNEYGSARFSTEKEIAKNFTKENLLDIQKAGFPVSFSKDLKYAYFDNETPHWCFLGSSGSGKSVTSVIPQCSFLANAKDKRSVFVTDPKGEIFTETSQMFKDNGYKIITIDFRNPQKSSHFNILEPIIKEYENYIRYSEIADEIEGYLKLLDNEISISNHKENKMEEAMNKNDISDDDFIAQTFNKRKEDNVDISKFEKYQNLSKEELESQLLENRNNSTSSYAETNRLINSLADMIFAEKGNQDPFWNNSASNLLQGLIGLFLEEYKDKKIERKKITMTSVKKFQNSSMEKQNFEKLKRYINKKPYGCKSKDSLTSIFSASENTYKSITAVFGAKMAIFDDVNVANVTSSSDFKFDCLGRKPTALFVIVPDEDKTYFTLVTIIVGLLYKELVKLANSNPTKKLDVQIDWLLDEFANCPPLNDIEAIVSVARSRGMRFQFYIQSFSQLDNVYGKEVAQIILDNCGLCYLKTNTMDTAETISKRLGKKTIESNSVSQSASLGILNMSNSNNANKSTSLMARDLLTPDEVMQLRFKTIIFPTKGYPIFRDTIFYKKFNCYKEGRVERKTQLLKDLKETYFTVEEINKNTITSSFLENQQSDSIFKAEKNIINYQLELSDKASQLALEELQSIILEKIEKYELLEKGHRKYLSVKLKSNLTTPEKMEINSRLRKDDMFEVSIDPGDGNTTVLTIEAENQFALEVALAEREKENKLNEKNLDMRRNKRIVTE